MKFYEEVKNIRRRQYLDCDIIRDEERFRSTMFRNEWSTWGRNRLASSRSDQDPFGLGTARSRPRGAHPAVLVDELRAVAATVGFDALAGATEYAAASLLRRTPD